MPARATDSRSTEDPAPSAAADAGAGSFIALDALDTLQRETPPRPLRVALVNMPFAAAHRPSIQCGLLKASLVRAGHAVDVHYLNLETAAEIGAEVYRELVNMRTDQFLGDWLFTTAAFGMAGDEDRYRTMCPGVDESLATLGMDFATLCRLRAETMPALVDRWLNAIDWGAYDLVGFSCTFEQNVPSFAVARRIKARWPGVRTVFGGANFDGDMGAEYVRAFPWIDYAVSGEGDGVLPALAGRISRGLSPAGLPGVTTRHCDGAAQPGGESPAIRQLDCLPDPDYDEFFAALIRLGRERVLGNAPPVLVFESARGCWWGEKHHCTFCGLNANGMAYRSKSPERVHDELRRLAGRYRIIDFEAVDNIIDMRYLDALCRPVTEERIDYSIFYEVKANLTRDQLHTLRRGGVTSIQPGIESLSSHVLALMRKGTTMLKNVRLLKWSYYYGMKVGWNLLTGFPGETAEDYAQQNALLPLLVHLPPPGGCGPLWLERFSPYFTDPDAPVHNRRPRPAYHCIYPAGSVDLEEIAYFFDYEMGDTLPWEHHAELTAMVDQWKDRWRTKRPMLVYQRASDWLQVIDRRDPAGPRAFVFDGAEAAAYEFCGVTDHTPAAVVSHLAGHGYDAGVDGVRGWLRHFCELGLMVAENDHFLSLALPVNGNW